MLLCARAKRSIGTRSTLKPGTRPKPISSSRKSTESDGKWSNAVLKLGKYSFGIGDRFAHQATAQLRACVKATQHGAEVIPVWNKSNREHLIVGSEPSSVRVAAEAAVRELG